MTRVWPLVVTIVGLAVPAYLLDKKAEKDINNAKREILSNQNITAKEYRGYIERVNSSKATWLGLRDSISQAESNKAEAIEKEIVNNYNLSAKQIVEYEKSAGKNLQKWSQINESLKARQLFKLSKNVVQNAKVIH